MGSMFRGGRLAGYGKIGLRTRRRKIDHEGTAGLNRIVPQIAVEGAYEGAREIKTESRGVRALLKGLEKLVRRSDAGAGVGDTNRNHPVARGSGDGDSLHRRLLERPFAVLRQIEQ